MDYESFINETSMINEKENSRINNSYR